jgi:anthranilate synthase component 1
MAVLPDRKTFLEKAKHGNLVPVWKEILADQETPVSAYERVRSYLRQREHASHTYLLESVEGGENIGRYSFIGGTPRTIIRAYGRRVEIVTSGCDPWVLEDIDPLDALKTYMQQFSPVVDDPSLPRFIGGAVGFLGYDVVSQFEPRVPVIENDDIGNPDMVFMVTDGLIVFDRVHHTLKVVANAHIVGDPNEAYDEALKQIDELCEALQTPIQRVLIDTHDEVEPIEPRSNTPKEEFLGMVDKAKEYIRSGDIIQTVLSQRFEVDNEADSLDVYRAR